MNQANEPDSSAQIPLKRKRGRPRKYPRPDNADNSNPRKRQNLNDGENALVPPGFFKPGGTQVSQRDKPHNVNDVVVGQVVSGVIEAVFDAGYLLSVTVGDCATTLRGVVFKPGRFVPISSDNDVAPNIQMIKRNEVPFPRGTYTQVSGYNRRSKERNERRVIIHRAETHAVNNGSPSVNQVPIVAASSNKGVSSEAKHVPAVAVQTANPIVRGKTVPVVLQPVDLSNGVPISNQTTQIASQDTHLLTMKGKTVKEAVHPENVSSATKEIPTVGSLATSSHHQTGNKMPETMQNKDGPPHEVDAKPMASPVAPQFEKLFEAMKRIQDPAKTTENEINTIHSGDKTSDEDSGNNQEDKVSDLDQPLASETSHSVQPNQQGQSMPASKTLEDDKLDKLIELSQVLQDDTEKS